MMTCGELIYLKITLTVSNSICTIQIITSLISEFYFLQLEEDEAINEVKVKVY